MFFKEFPERKYLPAVDNDWAGASSVGFVHFSVNSIQKFRYQKTYLEKNWKKENQDMQ